MADPLPYDNPLITRYADRPMVELWGPQRKHSTWRRLWLALAEAEHELGLKAHDGATPRNQLVGVIDALAGFAVTWRAEPTLGYTHFQPAQFTTVGKRACLWCYDFVLDLYEIESRLDHLRFRGAKGTTGTQASFLALFG